MMNADVIKPRAPENCPTPPSTFQLDVPVIVPGSISGSKCPRSTTENRNTCSLSSPKLIVPSPWKEVGPAKRNSDSMNASCPSRAWKLDSTPEERICVVRSEEHTSELQSLRHL